MSKILSELGIVIGLAVLMYGLWLLYHPMAYVVGGLTITGGSFFYRYGLTNTTNGPDREY